MEKKRKIVGYISSFEASNQISLDIQRRMIERYCQRNHLYCEHIFCDIGTRTNRRVNEKARAEKLGLPSCILRQSVATGAFVSGHLALRVAGS